MDTLFRWIHLSDIHFGHGDASHGWDQKLVIERLGADIASMREKDKTPIDAIVVTGDIAFSGNGRRNTEYPDAKATLLALGKDAGVTASQIFLVPGNHDVNRAADRDRNVARLLDGLREGRDKIDTALADAGDRALLARRMAAYLDFAADFAPFCLDPATAPPEERLSWTRQLHTKGGLVVRLVGLNTALLSANDEDQGKLFLGREQVAKALLFPPVEPGELVMVLSHHPLRTGWLGDEKDVDAWIRNNAHLHLSGHVHEADNEQSRSGAGGVFVRITAGAAHGDAEPNGVPASHGYSFGAVVREGGKARIRVWPRRWSAKRAAFRLDIENVPDEQDHADHDLREITLPAAPRGDGTPDAPIEIFFSYVPEDEVFKRKLEKAFSLLQRNKVITSFSAREIDPGASWKGVVDARLRSAKIIVLLISNDYLASDYCVDTEMEVARVRHETSSARVIPVVLRPTDLSWDDKKSARKESWFERLARLPRNGVPVSKWDDLDEAFTHIVREIRVVAERLNGSRDLEP